MFSSVLPVVGLSNVFNIIIHISVKYPRGAENELKVGFFGCISTVHVLQHAYVFIRRRVITILQSVKNVKYVALNIIFT